MLVIYNKLPAVPDSSRKRSFVAGKGLVAQKQACVKTVFRA